jgi:hypothetical protein
VLPVLLGSLSSAVVQVVLRTRFVRVILIHRIAPIHTMV